MTALPPESGHEHVFVLWARRPAESAIHLLCPGRIVRLKWRQHIAWLFYNGRHLLSAALRPIFQAWRNNK
jgi:hypothetical protein